MRTRLLVALAVVAVTVTVPVRTAFSAPDTRLAVVDGSGSEGKQIDFPASHIGLRWAGADDAVVEVRWDVDGHWKPWQVASVAHDLDDDRRGLVYSGLLRVPGASRVQTRVVSGTATAVELVAIDTERGPRHLVRAGPRPAGAIGAPPQPGVISRAQWGADESLRKGNREFAPITKLVVHHTVTTNNDPDPAATVRAVYSFHTQVRGWDDIGYNFLVDAGGRIYEGRSARSYAAGEIPTGEDVDRRGVVGAHAEGANTGSAGIALLGDFTSASPTAAAMASVEAWLAWKAARHEIDPQGASAFTRVSDGAVLRFANISGHRDIRATDCPGDRLYAALPAMRQRIAASVAGARACRAAAKCSGSSGLMPVA